MRFKMPKGDSQLRYWIRAVPAIAWLAPVKYRWHPGA